MKSYQESISEIRQKILLVEDQLRAEKKNLYKVDDLATEEREKWAKELKAEQVKVHLNEKELKKKEARLESLKAEYDEALKKYAELESENERLKKEIQKERRFQQEQASIHLAEVGTREKELRKIKEQQKELKVAKKWAKVFQEKELKALESENEDKLKEEAKEISDKLTKKIESFDEKLREIERCSLKPRLDKLKKMQEELAAVKAECDDLEKKNKELESQIALLERLPSV